MKGKARTKCHNIVFVREKYTKHGQLPVSFANRPSKPIQDTTHVKQDPTQVLKTQQCVDFSILNNKSETHK